MITSPKARFLESKEEAQAHHDLTGRMAFIHACDVAMLQVIAETPAVDDPVKAAANWHRLEGARAFQKVLLHLGEQLVPTPKVPGGNLDHRV